jgi:hypothetical protein
MSYQIPNANALVSFVKQFTGSTSDEEIRECIFLAELMMRNIELPALRSDPYAAENIVAADEYGTIPIPADMNRPILFFKMGSTDGQSSETGLGPWIVYDRIGDRDIITAGLIESLYLKPINIPSVYRGKFSEVGQKYHFLPKLGTDDVVNLYYFKSWPFLFSTEADGITEVQNNGVLQSWPEGYVYGTLHNYYGKRKNNDDAMFWKSKFDDAWNTVQDQNSKGKWSGGHTRITSIFQPRKDRRYSAK